MSTNKQTLIGKRKAALPLPDQPPVPSDWNSADATNVNVGSGAESGVRVDGQERGVNAGVAGGRETRDGLGGVPSDAIMREARGKEGVVDTMGRDYGYPEKRDPSSGLK
ncbi:hypothetical protein P154DRAFT_191858 [Amniculicola lignicola CBS 123094]|uniref:Uncharacterized protein n=1 Tax=Amniculicola lignicola CBS 123094 TaxID=1392246 RepID=A0A6A5WGF1_9PLEO|nr:hypothetical protein P154DRAFT_191858 [Amniculicola lignicola CBS 123094]